MRPRPQAVPSLILGLLFLPVGCVSQPSTQPSLAPTVKPAMVSLLVVGGQSVNRWEGGEVQIIREGERLSPVYVGLPIEKRDQIQTNENANVVLDLQPGVRVYLGTKTRITLSSLKVDWGEVLVSLEEFFFRVRGYFDLETTDTQAYARGTAFYVKVRENMVTYLVLEGRIEVQNKLVLWQTFSLGEGKKAILVPGLLFRGALSVDPQEMQSLRQWKDRLEKLIAPVPRGPVGVAVPSVIGKDESRAAAVLRQYGLRVGQISTRPTDKAKPGRVIEQQPRAGTVVKRNAVVNVVVAKSVPPPPVKVPSVVGKDQKRAATVLKQYGLRMGQISGRRTDEAKPGRVIEQQPKAGKVVKRNAAVDMVVAKALPKLTTEEVQPVLTSIQAIIDMQNNVTTHMIAALKDIRGKSYSDSAKKLEKARHEFKQTDLPYQELAKRQSRVEYRKLYAVAKDLRGIQNQMLALTGTMIMQARKNDWKTYNSSAKKFKALNAQYNTKAQEGNAIKEALIKQVRK